MLRLALAILALGSALGCSTVGVWSSAESIDPEIYWDVDDPSDPFGAKYAEFRERRSRDMADPSFPPALERIPAFHRSAGRPWDSLEASFPFDWAAIRASDGMAADELARVVRVRLAFDHPDLKIQQLMVGPGGVLPTHADGAPGAFIVLAGEGEVSVDGETQRVTAGATVRLAPYARRRLHASGAEPLRLLWIRWAPGGDQAYIDGGYYLTGANQHIQPVQANMPWDYRIFREISENQALGAPTVSIRLAPPGSPYARAANELSLRRRELGAERDPYPTVPVFGHESRAEWLSPETLKGAGFFFQDDIASMGPVADRMIEIARHKAIFRASRPDGRWDFNLSESAWGARSTYVEHSHVIPEFYYALSGPTIYGVDGKGYRTQPGDVIFNNSYAPHWIQGIEDGLVFDCFSSTFAPNGDRSVFERPFLLVEPLGEQPDSARLLDGIEFH